MDTKFRLHTVIKYLASKLFWSNWPFGKQCNMNTINTKTDAILEKLNRWDLYSTLRDLTRGSDNHLTQPEVDETNWNSLVRKHLLCEPDFSPFLIDYFAVIWSIQNRNFKWWTIYSGSGSKSGFRFWFLKPPSGHRKKIAANIQLLNVALWNRMLPVVP